MKKNDVIIVGAGAAGLMAAKELAKSGLSVIVIEAKNRVGGRIFTLRPPGFSTYIEAGAEFIHGDAPVTQALLNEAATGKEEMAGETYRVNNGELLKTGEFVDGMPVLIEKMKRLTKDIPLQEFIDKNFPEPKYDQLKKSVKRLVEGYDAADITRVSTFSIRDELIGGGINTAFRPNGGYISLIEFLAKEIKKYGGTIKLLSPVKEVKWENGKVEVLCNSNEKYTASKILITVSAGVLQSDDRSESFIRFSPPVQKKTDLFHQIGFGTVIKIIMEFKDAFWENSDLVTRPMPGLDFLITDTVPVTAWWTQVPRKLPILTAWMAGPNAEKLTSAGNDVLSGNTIAILEEIYKTPKNYLSGMIKAEYIANWSPDPFVLGAYSYSTVHSAEARGQLSEPIENTIYFAGEALFDGETAGTVEAALSNGMETAERIKSSF